MNEKKSFRIMVVDDEPEISQGLATTLHALTGHETAAFDDPYRALQDFLHKSYHLVITDIKMPNIDGIELVKRMKNQRPSCKFIVITAHKTIEVVSQVNRLGASYIFYKPVDVAALEEAVQFLYGRYLYWQDRLAEVEGKIPNG